MFAPVIEYAAHPTEVAIRDGEYLAVVGSGPAIFADLAGRLRADGPDEPGLVFRAYHLPPHRTVTENVLLGMRYRGVPRAERTERAIQALTSVGLGHRAHSLPVVLSSGERRRVTIARALVNRPSVLLCDEPTGDLNARACAAVLDVFDQLHAAGLTILVVTRHDAVAARAGRVVRIQSQPKPGRGRLA